MRWTRDEGEVGRRMGAVEWRRWQKDGGQKKGGGGRGGEGEDEDEEDEEDEEGEEGEEGEEEEVGGSSLGE